MNMENRLIKVETLSIALVIPVFNEEDVLPLLIDEIERFRTSRNERISVLFIDDGSTDGTNSLIRTLATGLVGYRLIGFSRNFGHQLAVTAGLHALALDLPAVGDESVMVDAAIVMDSDLQDPLEIAGRMIDTWKEGHDVVYGVRVHRDGVTAGNKFLYRLYYRIFAKFSDLDAPLDAGDFRLLSRRVILAYRQFGEQQPYVRGLIAWLGYSQVGIEYDRPARAAGKSKYSWKKLFQLAFDGLTSFSGKPLRYAVRMGLIVSALSSLGLVWALVERLVLDTNLPGWASLVFIGFFFGGLQLFFLGVVGSYLARVYDEVKSRPRYILKDAWSSGELEHNFGAIEERASMSSTISQRES